MFTTGFLPFSEPHRILQPRPGSRFCRLWNQCSNTICCRGWPGFGHIQATDSELQTVYKAVPPHTHILYLQIWIEMGLAGFVTFMWYIYRTIKNSVIGIYNSSLTLKTILAAGTAALCGILVTSLVEYSWYYPRVMVMFWVLLG